MSRSGMQRLLAAMPGDGGPIATAKLTHDTGLTGRDTATYFERLRLAGLAERVARGVYRLTAAGRSAKATGQKLRRGPKGPLTRQHICTGTFRDRVWKALRTRRKATIADLVVLAGTGDEKWPENNAAKYLGLLVRAGFVVRMRRREPGIWPSSPGHRKYFLQKDPGPKALVYRPKFRDVYDPNTRKSYSLETGKEIAP